MLTGQSWRMAGERMTGSQDPRVPPHSPDEGGSCCSFHYKAFKGFAIVDGATYALGEREGREECASLDAKIEAYNLMATNEKEGGSPHPLQGLIGAQMTEE